MTRRRLRSIWRTAQALVDHSATRLRGDAEGHGASPTAIEPVEAARLAEQGRAELLDVRERFELERFGMAPGARWHPNSDTGPGSPAWQELVATLPRDRILAVYCAIGVRSARVAAMLRELGIDARNVSGGLRDWVAAGLPLEPVQREGYRRPHQAYS